VVEIVVFHDAIGPESLHQLIFAEQTAVVFDEDAKRVEELGTQADELAGTRQAAFGDIQMERFETKNHSPPSQNG
jgi:hypothetical protein